MRALRQLLGIDYKDHVTNVTVRNIVTSHIGRHQELLQIVKSRKLKWFGHTTRGAVLAWPRCAFRALCAEAEAEDGLAKSGVTTSQNGRA